MTPLPSALAQWADRVGGALGGTYTGYMLRHHLRYWVLCFVTVVATLTATNVSVEIARVWAEVSANGTAEGLERIALYLTCRLLDNGAQAFCVSVLLGVVWAESIHALGGRLLMVRIIGLTFVQRSTALILLAALSVPAQFTFDNVVRPWAAMTLSREGLGEFGWKYRRERAATEQWFAFGDTTMRMTVLETPRPTIRDALVFRVDGTGELASIVTAATITPPEPGHDTWTMHDVRSWRIGDPQSAAFGMPALRPADGDVALDVPIGELGLAYRGLDPRFVPLGDLVRLASERGLPGNAPDYRAWLVIRFMQSGITGLACLCVGGIFAVLLERRSLPIAAAGGLVAAYCCHFYNRLASLIVEHAAPSVGATAALFLAALVVVVWGLLVMLRRGEATA